MTAEEVLGRKVSGPRALRRGEVLAKAGPSAVVMTAEEVLGSSAAGPRALRRGEILAKAGPPAKAGCPLQQCRGLAGRSEPAGQSDCRLRKEEVLAKAGPPAKAGCALQQ